MEGDGNTLAVVDHRDAPGVGIHINVNLSSVLGVNGMLVQSIHQNLVENLEKGGRVGQVLLHKEVFIGVQNPRRLGIRLDGTNITVGALKNVLEV